MGIAMAKAGGIGIINRNLTIDEQIKEIRKVKSKTLLVGAAVGASEKELTRANKLLKENLDIIVSNLTVVTVLYCLCIVDGCTTTHQVGRNKQDYVMHHVYVEPEASKIISDINSRYNVY